MLSSVCKDVYNHFLDLEEAKFLSNHMPFNIFFDHTAVKNYTDVYIPPDVLLALSFDPKFLFPVFTRSNDNIALISEVSNIIDSFIIQGRDMAKVRAKSIILDDVSHKNRLRDSTNRWLSLVSVRIRRLFNNNPDIIAVRSDKGKAMTIIKRST